MKIVAYGVFISVRIIRHVFSISFVHVGLYGENGILPAKLVLAHGEYYYKNVSRPNY